MASGSRWPWCLLPALAVFATGCPTPLTHPLRASDGPIVQAALSASVTSGDARTCYPSMNHCTEAGSSFAGVWPQVTLGYGHVFAERLGVMGGVTLPTVASVQSDKPAAKFTGFLFATLQNEHGSVGIGPELAVSGWALAMGAEWRFLGAGPSVPAVGAYARWFLPFSAQNDGSWWADPHRTMEFGVRVRLGPLFGQYSYFAGVGAPLVQPLFVEGSYTTEAFHIFAVGFNVDGEFIARRRQRRQEVSAPRATTPAGVDSR